MTPGDAQDKIRIARITAGSAQPPPAGDGLPRVPGYQLTRFINHGGQASVYAAVSTITGRPVAIKILTGGRDAESRKRRRFDREARLLARLDHPNIVGVLDYGRTEDGALYFAMDLVDGQPLDQAIDSSTAAGIMNGIALFNDVCAAVQHAHERGIVHRDLKSANILVSNNGVRVLDFGLAQDLSNQQRYTQTGEVLGSLPWSSPEQVAGEKSGVASDIYALGVLLYRIVSGRMPIEDNRSIADTVDDIRHGRIIPLKVATALPQAEDLKAIVACALAVRHTDRYRSVAELSEALRNWQSARPVRRYRRRWRSAVLASVIGIAAVAAGSIWLVRPESLAIQSPLKQPSYINSAGMKMILIPRILHPSIRSHSRVPAYWVASTEVTVKQFNAVMGWPEVTNPNVPMNNVSYEEAYEFCRLLSERENKLYRLPTESEWEHAARAGNNSTVGTNLPIASVAWISSIDTHEPQEVGKKLPNVQGLHDMLGNVAEWCVTDELVTSQQAIRGGSYNTNESNISVQHRELRKIDYRARNVGFRIISDDLDNLKQ